MHLKTVASFQNVQKAHIAKGLLESEGIDCQLSNETIVQLMAVGSVELQVNDQQFDQALSLLQAHSLI